MFQAANIGSSFRTVRDRHMVTMKHYWEVEVGPSESAKNLTLGDLEEVISRSRKWKWPVSSKRLLLGPGCLWTKMFTIAQSIKMHLDLWPWLTLRGHSKVMNVKIAYIFCMVRDKHVVTMKHYWEVDIGLSESAKTFDLGWPWQGHFNVTKVKMARIV